MARVFYESDIVELVACKSNIANLIHALTYGEELPVEGSEGIQAVKPFKVLEEPEATRLRVAVALGLAPVSAIAGGDVLDVDQLALRIRERMGAGVFSADLAVLKGEKPNPPGEATDATVLQSLRERIKREGQAPVSEVVGDGVNAAEPKPSDEELKKQGAALDAHSDTSGTPQTEAPPLDEGRAAGVSVEEAAKTLDGGDATEKTDKSEEPAALKGELPDGFPGKKALGELDPPVHTYFRVRKLIATGTEGAPWYKDVAGIAAPTAAKIEEAVGVAPADDEEE